MRGTHPQTGAEIDEWMCAISAMPMLQVEVAKEARLKPLAVDIAAFVLQNAYELNYGFNQGETAMIASRSRRQQPRTPRSAARS